MPLPAKSTTELGQTGKPSPPQALLFSILFAGACTLAVGLASAQDKVKKETEKPKDKEKGTAKEPAPGDVPPEIAAWLKASKPGEHHKKLEPLNGSWKTEGKFWMSPGAPPMTSPGACKRSWILDGRFLQEEVEGEFMGMPFKGIGLNGYDNLKKKYVSSWIDSMTTGIMTSYGSCDESGKEFTYTGEYDDPFTGKPKKSRMVLRIKSENEHVLESFDTGPDGKEVKSMEIAFTRAKPN